MECFSKIQTFLLFNLLGLRPVLSALETFKAFLADFPTVFLALPPTTTFQPFSRPQWTGHSTVFQAWLLGCSMLYVVTLFGFLIVPCFTIFTEVLHDGEARNHPRKHATIQCVQFGLVVEIIYEQI